MIKQFTNGLIQGIGLITILGVAGIAYATVTTNQTLTADLFNESMVPTGAVMAFYGNDCPVGWNKANGSGDEKMVDGTLGNLDLRGGFIRGWVDDGTVDSGRGLASWQTDALEIHQHNYVDSDGEAGYTNVRDWDNEDDSTDAGMTFGDYGFDISSAVGNPIGATTATETRPRNIALLYCIKN